jgi:hypothetical protein
LKFMVLHFGRGLYKFVNTSVSNDIFLSIGDGI